MTGRLTTGMCSWLVSPLFKARRSGWKSLLQPVPMPNPSVVSTTGQRLKRLEIGLGRTPLQREIGAGAGIVSASSNGGGRSTSTDARLPKTPPLIGASSRASLTRRPDTSASSEHQDAGLPSPSEDCHYGVLVRDEGLSRAQGYPGRSDRTRTLRQVPITVCSREQVGSSNTLPASDGDVSFRGGWSLTSDRKPGRP